MAEMQRYRARTIGVNRFRETLSEPVASRLEQRAKRLRREWGPVRLCRTGRGKRFPRRITPRSALPNGAREAFPSLNDSVALGDRKAAGVLEAFLEELAALLELAVGERGDVVLEPELRAHAGGVERVLRRVEADLRDDPRPVLEREVGVDL